MTTMTTQDKINATIATLEAAGLTHGSAHLLAYIVEDAPNWSGSPMLDLTASDKGNLTDLKKNGYLTTQYDSDTRVTYAFFTDAGTALIKTTAMADYLA
mgnify:FL=1|jgi:DNA-binding MarR family transcriptional regulator